MLNQTDHYTLIAKVEYTKSPQPGDGPRWSRLVPLYLANGKTWTRTEDRSTNYPDAGFVFWWDSPVGTETKGSCWVVEVKYEKEIPGRDSWKVVSGRRLIQLVDPELSPVHFRRLLANNELTIGTKPVGEIFLQVPGKNNHWVGPLTFRQLRGARYIGPMDIPTGFLDVFEIPLSDTQSISLEPETILVPSPCHHSHRHRIDYFAAQSDENLLRGLLRRIPSLDDDVREGVEISERVFESYLNRLDEAELIGPNELRERSRLQAARELLKEVHFDQAFLQETLDALLSHPQVEDQIQDAVDRETKARIDKIDVRIEEVQLEKREAIDLLEDKLKAKSKELAGLDEVQKKKRKEFQEEIEDIAQEILRRPMEILAKEELAHALIRSFRSTDQGAGAEEIEWQPQGGKFESFDNLLSALQVGAQAIGIEERIALSSLSAFLAGRCLVLPGEESWDVVSLLASTIAAGLSWAVSVPTKIFCIDDLLNQPAIPLDSSSSKSHSLGDLLQFAEHSSEVSLIVLNGLNRAPLETAFEDLLLAFREEVRGLRISWRSRMTEPPSLISCPPHILLAATIAEGPSCFSIPKRIASQLAFLAGQRTRRNRQIALPRMHIDREAWDAFRSVENPDIKTDFMDGSNREAGIYVRVFHDETVGLCEYLISRRTVALINQGTDSSLPPNVARRIDDLREQGVLHQLEQCIVR